MKSTASAQPQLEKAFQAAFRPAPGASLSAADIENNVYLYSVASYLSS